MHKFVKIFDKTLSTMLILFVLLHVISGLCAFHVIDIPLLATRKNPLLTYAWLSLGVLIGIRSFIKTELPYTSRIPQQQSRYFLPFFAVLCISNGMQNLTESSVALIPVAMFLVVVAIRFLILSGK